MRMEGTIECPPSPFNSTDDPFDIRDPLKEAIRKFGNEQDCENFTEEYVMELVRDKINDIKVDIENPALAVEEIVEYLEEESIKVSKKVKDYIRIVAVSTKVNFLENLERAEGKGTVEMALADSKWMKKVAKYIMKNRDDPEKIKIFWQQYDSFFLKFEEQNEKDLFADKRDTRQGPEVIKRGLLAEIASMDLLKEMAENIKGCRNAKIEPSTGEEDTGKQIDFFLTITIRDKEINATQKIPVQVKSCNLSNFAGKKAPAEKVEFVFKNMINTEGTREKTRYDLKYSYQEIIKKKIEDFFGGNENKGGKREEHHDGIFIILPYGKLNPEMFDYEFDFGRNKKGENKKSKRPELINCIEENGTPNEMLKKYFLSEAMTTRDMETRVKEIFRHKQMGH